MILMCLKIFLARILDVSIATFRQLIMIKGKILIGTILAFFEVFIWFLIAREALLVSIDSLFIPISYCLGYATGTFIGAYIARIFMKGYITLQIIVEASNKKLFKALKFQGYKFSLIRLENEENDKVMIFLNVQPQSLKKVTNFILEMEENAFISISDSRNVLNGTLK